MKAVKVCNIFGPDWKQWHVRDKYNGVKYQFKYNNWEYLTLDVVVRYCYDILDSDVEEIDYEN